jgi:hypothetical protein
MVGHSFQLLRDGDIACQVVYVSRNELAAEVHAQAQAFDLADP